MNLFFKWSALSRMVQVLAGLRQTCPCLPLPRVDLTSPWSVGCSWGWAFWRTSLEVIVFPNCILIEFSYLRADFPKHFIRIIWSGLWGHLFKIHVLGTYLIVQWLRLLTPSARDPGSVPGQGIRSHMLQLKILQWRSKSPPSSSRSCLNHWGSLGTRSLWGCRV